MGSTHIPSAMAQVPMPLAAGYPQPGKGYSGTVPFSYMYPQTVATYPTAGYPSPPTMAAQFPTQSQISYSPFNVKKDPDGPSPTTPAGMGGYPFYYAKQ